MTCKKPTCTRLPRTRGYCEQHYRQMIRMGFFGYVDASPSQEHVAKLRALGWTYEQIGEAAGLSMRQAWDLDHKTFKRVLRPTEKRVLSIPLTPAVSHRGADATGTMRRVQALQWMGWPLTVIGPRVGLQPYTLSTLRSRGEPVSWRVRNAVADLYEELSHLSGPSRCAAGRARARGYVPPLAWDDDTIDDPDAEPNLGGESESSRRERAVEEYEHLSSMLSDEEIARKLGITLPTLRDYVRYRGEAA